MMCLEKYAYGKWRNTVLRFALLVHRNKDRCLGDLISGKIRALGIGGGWPLMVGHALRVACVPHQLG